MIIKNIVEKKFDFYITTKNDSDAFKILSKRDKNPYEFIFGGCLFFIQSLVFIFLLDMLEKHLNFGIMILSAIFIMPLLIITDLFLLQKYDSQHFHKKVQKMRKEDLEKLFKDNFRNDFLNTYIDNELIDLLKIKYSAEHFQTLILSSKNKIPTYSEVLSFDEKYEFWEDQKYKIDIHNIKKEKILDI